MHAKYGMWRFTMENQFAVLGDPYRYPAKEMKRPHRFNIEVVEAFVGTTTYTIEHGIVHRKSPKYPTLTRTLKLIEWQGFWSFSDYLNLWDWKSEYSPADIDLVFRDGMTWSLDIAFDKSKHVRAIGNNVYPSFSNETTSTIAMDRFGLLLDFVDRMLLSSDNRIQTFYSVET